MTSELLFRPRQAILGTTPSADRIAVAMRSAQAVAALAGSRSPANARARAAMTPPHSRAWHRQEELAL